MVQNPIKPNYILNEAGDLVVDESETIEDLMEKYHQKGWLPYQWGVWVTSYARLKLHEGIWCITDPHDFLYCDTDSVKYLGDYEENFKKLNDKYLDPELSAPDRHGNMHYIGIYEDDGEYRQFKTLGAKKYCYVDMEDQLHVTISGVNKKKAPAELKNIKRFKEGFVFRAAGGTESIFSFSRERRCLGFSRREADSLHSVM